MAIDVTENIAFHDLQQGGLTRDLPYYRELARRSNSTLELGAGTGRIALELAGLTDLSVNELDEHLMRELVRRAEARSLSVTPVPSDATKLDLGRRFDLILAPASFAQIVGGRDARQALLRVIARHLEATGVAVVAIADVDEILRECATPADRRHLRTDGRTVIVHQLAATEIEAGAQVSWQRTVRDRVDTARLTIHRVSTEEVAAEADACGLHLSRVHHDPGDAASLGSSYCVLNHACPHHCHAAVAVVE